MPFPLIGPLVGFACGWVLGATGQPKRVGKERGRPGRDQTPFVMGALPPHRDPVPDCGAFPWYPEDIDSAIWTAIDAGMRTPEDAANVALNRVYKYTPEGDRLIWPSVAGDCATITAIESRVAFRAKRHLAQFEDELADKTWWDSGGQ